MSDLKQLGSLAKEASRVLATMGTNEKNHALTMVADGLEADAAEILAENEKDMEKGRERGMPEGLLDRLLLTPSRIRQMAEGLRQVVALDDPIGEVLSMKNRPNGLTIGKKRVPIGVVGMIYEARPNVTADAFGLCFKTGNAVILKGGSDALYSNMAMVASIKRSLKKAGVTEHALELITDTDREITNRFMKMNEYLDVLIPRGGAGLIRAVVNNATVPVISLFRKEQLKSLSHVFRQRLVRYFIAPGAFLFRDNNLSNLLLAHIRNELVYGCLYRSFRFKNLFCDFIINCFHSFCCCFF